MLKYFQNESEIIYWLNTFVSNNSNWNLDVFRFIPFEMNFTQPLIQQNVFRNRWN